MTHATATPPATQAGEPTVPDGVPALIEAAFDALDRAGVPWTLLRGERELAADGGDVDVLVAASARPAAERALLAAGFVPLPSWGRGSHRFHHAYDPDTDRWVKLDVVTELAFGRYAELPTDLAAAWLERRDRAAGPARLDPDDAFWAFLLHALLDRAELRPDDLAGLRERAVVARADAPGSLAVAPLLPRGWDPARVIAAAHDADPARLTRLARGLRRQWLRRMPVRVVERGVRGRLARRATPLLRAVRGRGLGVALLAPDGAGKSTLATSLETSFPVPVRRVYLGLYGHGSDARSRGPGGRFGLPGRIAWVWRRWLGARGQEARGRIVVFDRHVLDLAVAPPGDSRKVRLRRSVLVRSCPRPDLTLILDVPGDELFRRKGEHDPASLERQRGRYLELAERLPRAAVIDAAADAETVRRRAVGAIWAAHAARAMAR